MDSQIKSYSSRYYLEAAKKLNLKTKVLHNDGLIQISHKTDSHLFYYATTDTNTATASAICRSKSFTNSLLSQHGLSVPTQFITSSLKDANNHLTTRSYPLVLKPNDALAGRDVYTNVNSLKEAKMIAQKILSKYKHLLIEDYLIGNDYRFLVLNHQVIGVLQRLWPTVTGDGKSSIKKLIKTHSKFTRIGLGDQVISALKNQGHTLSDILPQGKIVRVRSNANQATGGTVISYPLAEIHPEIIELASQATKLAQVNLSGVDIMIRDHTQPVKNNAAIIELNHSPCFVMHMHPDQGPAVDTPTLILKSIFNL